MNKINISFSVPPLILNFGHIIKKSEDIVLFDAPFLANVVLSNSEYNHTKLIYLAMCLRCLTLPC